MYIILLFGLNLRAESREDNIPLNIMYLIPEEREYVTQGKILVLENNLSCQPRWDGIDVDYFNLEDGFEHYTIFLSPPKGQKFQTGIYKNAKRFNSIENPGIDFSGNGRGYNYQCGEFEILEIEYDEEGQIQSFAADFVIGCNGELLRGTVRFNSSYRIDYYFIKMAMPKPFNWESNQLVYVNKKGADISQALIASDNSCKVDKYRPTRGGLNFTIEISERWFYDGLFYDEQMTFHIPKGMNLAKAAKTSSFRIEPLSVNSNSDFFNLDKSKPMLIFHRKPISVASGTFTIRELGKDLITGNLVSFAIDFEFEDNLGESYRGIVRYNSSVPANPNEDYSEWENFSDSDSFDFSDWNSDWEDFSSRDQAIVGG